MSGLGRALPSTYVCGLRLFPWVCVEWAADFSMLMFALSGSWPPCQRPLPKIEIGQQQPPTKEKADFRCVPLQSLIAVKP
jgi:hypothetical protein